MMLRQEMESYPIIIGACAHNKDDSKQNEDTWWWMWVDIGKQIVMLLPMGVMALLRVSTWRIFWEVCKLKVSEYMAGLYYVP